MLKVFYGRDVYKYGFNHLGRLNFCFAMKSSIVFPLLLTFASPHKVWWALKSPNSMYVQLVVELGYLSLSSVVEDRWGKA